MAPRSKPPAATLIGQRVLSSATPSVLGDFTHHSIRCGKSGGEILLRVDGCPASATRWLTGPAASGNVARGLHVPRGERKKGEPLISGTALPRLSLCEAWSEGPKAAIGAATGATVGAAGGAIAGGTSAQAQFETAYDACMRNRGYKLLK